MRAAHMMVHRGRKGLVAAAMVVVIKALRKATVRSRTGSLTMAVARRKD